MSRCFVLLALLLAPHASGDDCHAGSADRDGVCRSSDRPVEVEDASLLQRLQGGARQSAQAGRGSRRPLNVVQAYEGGGFRALAGGMGLGAGLLSLLGPGLAGFGELYGGVDVFASNSGGSWYAMQTLFSSRAAEMQSKMAEDPKNASAVFNELWTDALLAAPVESAANSWQAAMMHCVMSNRDLRALELNATARGADAEALAGAEARAWSRALPSTQDVMDIVDILMKSGAFGGGTWQTVVDLVFGRPAGINETMPVSSKPNPFAEGKLLLVCASIPTPGSPGADNGDIRLYLGVDKENVTQSSITYKAMTRDGSSFPIYIPAKYTFWLGDGAEADAPFPFCPDADCFDLFFKYSAKTKGNRIFTAESEPLSQMYDSAFIKKAGSLPIVGVSAASSAFAGTAVMTVPQGNGAMVQPILKKTGDCVSLAQWATNKPRGKTFQTGEQQQSGLYNKLWLDQRTVNSVAKAGLQAVIDGVFTDDLGVANALAIMTSGQASGSSLQVKVWFYGNEPAVALLNLFEGAVTPYGPAFSSPAADEVEKLIVTSPAVMPDPSNATWVTKITYGSIKACKTVSNKWYGIQSGFTVDIDFFWVVTTIGIGGTQPFSDFGEFAGEITKTIADNRKTLEPIVKKIYR